MNLKPLRDYAVFQVRNGDTRLVFQGTLVDCLIFEKSMADLAATSPGGPSVTWRTEALRP